MYLRFAYELRQIDNIQINCRFDDIDFFIRVQLRKYLVKS